MMVEAKHKEVRYSSAAASFEYLDSKQHGDNVGADFMQVQCTSTTYTFDLQPREGDKENFMNALSDQ